MKRTARRCEVCGRYHKSGVYYRIVIKRVDVTKGKARTGYKESVIRSWQVCSRHMRALRHMMDVITKRREQDARGCLERDVESD